MADGKFLKQPKQQAKKRETKKAKETLMPAHVVVAGPDNPSCMRSPSMQHEINYVAGLGGVEQSLDWIARSLDHLTSDEHAVSVSLGQGCNTDPIKLTLSDNDYEDTMGRLVTAFERIADSVAKLAGFSVRASNTGTNRMSTSRDIGTPRVTVGHLDQRKAMELVPTIRKVPADRVPHKNAPARSAPRQLHYRNPIKRSLHPSE